MTDDNKLLESVKIKLTEYLKKELTSEQTEKLASLLLCDLSKNSSPVFLGAPKQLDPKKIEELAELIQQDTNQDALNWKWAFQFDRP